MPISPKIERVLGEIKHTPLEVDTVDTVVTENTNAAISTCYGDVSVLPPQTAAVVTGGYNLGAEGDVTTCNHL